MNNDNCNFIEPTPEILSKELSIHNNLPKQLYQEKDEVEEEFDQIKGNLHGNANSNSNENDIKDKDSSSNVNIKDKDRDIAYSLHSNTNNNNEQPKESSLMANSVKHQRHNITTSSNNNNNMSKDHSITNPNFKTSPQPQPQQQLQLQQPSQLTKPKNYTSANPSSSSHRPEVNLNDIQGLSYRYNKELSHITIPKDEVFMNRMLFDIFKRKEKETKINELINNSKFKLSEKERRKGFNRLIDDANRRLEVKGNLEENKTKLNEENAFNQHPRKYKNDQWNGIYNERFIKFQSEKEKKQIENIKIKKDQERKNEEEAIELCKIKKAPMKVIKENAKRMYDDALKKRLLKNDEIAQREKMEKTGKGKEKERDGDVKKLREDLKAKQQNRKLMRKNIENMLRDDNEDEEDLRNVPNPICQTEGKKKGNNGVNIKEYLNNMKDDNGISNSNGGNGNGNGNGKGYKMNDKEFFKPSSRLHCDEKEAEQIVQEFFTNKLLKH